MNNNTHKIKTMKYLLILIFVLTGFLNTAKCQRVGEGIFVDYQWVVNQLKTSKSIKDFTYKWNYGSILLLDSSEIEIINKIRPDVVKEFRRYFSKPTESKYRKTVLTDKKSIRDCVSNFEAYCITENGLEMGAQLDYPYYIKDDKIAVFEIYGDFWSESYRLTLQGNKVLVELVGSIIE